MKLVIAVLLVLLAGLAVNAAPRGRQVSSYTFYKHVKLHTIYTIIEKN